MEDAHLYPLTKVFSHPPLTLTLSPRRGERGEEEETFGKAYKSLSVSYYECEDE
jgi:hypothetical protein